MHILKAAYAFIFAYGYRSFWFFFVMFGLMYVAGVLTSSAIIKAGTKKHTLRPITSKLKPGQIRSEVIYSLQSIFVFSLQALPMQWLIKHGWFNITFTPSWHIALEIPMLFLWNEVHFYLVHRLLHTKWLFKKVHITHHQSHQPTVYSIYSFHWFEAFLLGTVIFFPLAVHSFNIISILTLPVFSIILNLAGHSNHESTHHAKNINNLSRFSFRHAMHHKYSRGNYGFMLPWLDAAFKTQLKHNG